MSGLEDQDVEALLESSTKNAPNSKSVPHGSPQQGFQIKGASKLANRTREDSRERERRLRDRSRERRNRERERGGDLMGMPRDPYHPRRRSDERDRFRSRRPSNGNGGDFYRGSGRPRGRSRSPDFDRRYRPGNRRERDIFREGDDFIPLLDEDRPRERPAPRRISPRGPPRRSPSRRMSPRRTPPSARGRREKTPEPQLNDDEKDRRTLFVQQLAQRLRTKDLLAFFEEIGPVNAAQIVKDRVSGRSKGVGYVEYKNEESVEKAIKQLTGKKLAGVPIICQNSEAEKNRAARTNEGANGNTNSVPFHRLYVGNIHFSITELDLKSIFEPFGELEYVQLQTEEQGRSRGYGFVQFNDASHAKDALEKMNGFELAGRPIRVGLGNDKFTADSTAALLQKFGTQPQGGSQGSSFSGAGGRGVHAGGSNAHFDRAGGRDDKGASAASALNDTDVSGVNFNNYNRESLMRKLLGEEDPESEKNQQSKGRDVVPKPIIEELKKSRCLLLRGMFNPAEETEAGWEKSIEDDVRSECDTKYGHVVHISLDPNTDGDIHIAFERIEGGDKAMKGLNGRFFGGRMITAQPVVEAVYKSQFPKAF